MFITRFLHFRKITNLEILASIIRIQIYLKPDNAQPVDNLLFFKIAKSTFETYEISSPCFFFFLDLLDPTKVFSSLLLSIEERGRNFIGSGGEMVIRAKAEDYWYNGHVDGIYSFDRSVRPDRGSTFSLIPMHSELGWYPWTMVYATNSTEICRVPSPPRPSFSSFLTVRSSSRTLTKFAAWRQ